MNCKKINQIPLNEFLSRLGFKPVKVSGNRIRFFSPFRQESTPSFDVSISRNLWIDRGTGEGGTLVDLCMRLENISVNEVVRRFNNDSFSFHQLSVSKPRGSMTTPFKVLSKELLKEKRLCDYLEERAIKLRVARQIVKEYHYTIDERSFFALGIDNIKGGVELRNKYFKGTLGPKAISYFKGSNDKILVFEGFMDLLSHLSYSRTENISNHIIVLNTTNNALAAKKQILELSRKLELFLFLDRDEAGKKANDILKDLDRKVIDMSYIYEGYNDYNEMLMDKPKQNILKGMSR